MSDSLIYAKYVNIILENLVTGEAATRYTKLPGKVIQGSIFKTTRERPRHIKYNKCFWLLKNWRSTMALTNDRYTYRVTWSGDDNEYVGLCAEFPSLSWLAGTPEAALKGIRKLVAGVVKDMSASEETIPEPIASRSYSGKFMIRIPPDVHRKLAVQAAESGVSLNRIASSKLSQ
jgi:predicted HicB family RNase H-like nuclease